MKLILYNDDFGVTYGLTNAVKESFLNGTTTSASIRTNGLAFQYAVEEVLPTIPGLELGLHVNLTEGPPDAPPSKVSRLLNRRGYFKRSFLDYLVDLKSDQKLLKEIEIEMRVQFEKATACGLTINHVNGHQHIHMIPPVFQLLCQITKERGMRFIRIPLEPFFFSPCLHDTRHMICNLNLPKYLLLKWLSLRALMTLKRYDLKWVGCFVGILYTGRMNLNIFKRAMERLERHSIGAAEVLFHPANIDHEKDAGARGTRVPRYYYLDERRIEKETLLSVKMKEFLVARGIELVNHQILGKLAQQGR